MHTKFVGLQLILRTVLKHFSQESHQVIEHIVIYYWQIGQQLFALHTHTHTHAFKKNGKTAKKEGRKKENELRPGQLNTYVVVGGRIIQTLFVKRCRDDRLCKTL